MNQQNLKNFIIECEKEFEEEMMLASFGFGEANRIRLKKLFSRQISFIKMIMEMVESEKVSGYNNYDLEAGHNQALDTISSKLKELIKE